MIMPFGKHRGKQLRDVPEPYLVWVLDNCNDISPTLRWAIEEVLEIRQDEPASGVPALPIAELVDPWYRRLATEFHPDLRGTHDGMVAVNRAKDLLLEMAGATQ